MSSSLTNKNILFFAPKFFGYDKAIALKLTQLGATVHQFDERPDNTFFVKAAIRINRNFIKRTIHKYYKNILKQTAAVKYDYVFVVNLESMTQDIVRLLRKQQPDAIFILYMWDSIKNKKPAQQAFTQFDWCYSFDKTDAAQFKNVLFRPLFFIDEYDNKNWRDIQDPELGLTFIGTVHSDRYNLVTEVKKQAERLHLSTFFYMYFHSKILFYYKKLKDRKFYKARYKEFSFNPISAHQIIETVKNSKAVLDIQHPYQTGLTMRTIEMIGTEKKLITTNHHVKEYDFYNSDNICVIDRIKPCLKPDFFNTSYQPLPAEIKFKYSLEGWLSDIFRLK